MKIGKLKVFICLVYRKGRRPPKKFENMRQL